MKEITVLPADEIIIKFNDKELKATFNMLAVGYMQEELAKPGNKKISITEFSGLILYGGIRVNNPSYTLKEGMALAKTIRPVDLNEIIEQYIESTGGNNEMVEEAKKKILMEMLTKIAK